MLPIRKRMKKKTRHYLLRKKMNVLQKTNNNKKNYVFLEDVIQIKDRFLNVIRLFPEALN